MKKVLLILCFVLGNYAVCIAQEQSFNKSQLVKAFKEIIVDTSSGFNNIIGKKIHSIKYHATIALPNSRESYIYKFSTSNYASYYSIFYCTKDNYNKTLQVLQESILEALNCTTCSFIHDVDSAGFTCVKPLADGSLVTPISISSSKASQKTQNQVYDVIKVIVTAGSTSRDVYLSTKKFSSNNKIFTTETNKLIEVATNKFETLKSTRLENEPAHFSALQLNSAGFPDTLFTAKKIFANADYAYVFKQTDTMHMDGKVHTTNQINLIHFFNAGKDSLTAEKKMKKIVSNCNAALGEGFYTDVNRKVSYLTRYNKKLNGKLNHYTVGVKNFQGDFFIVLDAIVWSDIVVE